MTTISDRHVLMLSAAALLLAWVLVLVPVAGFWNYEPQYAYGWAIPFLTLFLLYERWQDRPAPTQSERVVPGGLMLVMILIVSALAFVATRWVSEAVPDYRPFHWLAVGLVLVATLSWLHRVGGMSWLRHFSFPMCFILLGLPWFLTMEIALVQGLMRANATLVAEILFLGGWSAHADGNIIRLGENLIVGIDEACSGVRSLQATLMVSVFIGEFYRMSVPHRLILVGMGFIFAMLGNIARTFFLAWSTYTGGEAAVADWHDPAGTSVLVFTLAATWLFSLWLTRKQTVAAIPEGDRMPQYGEFRRALPLAIGIGAVALAAEGITQAWYAWRESQRDVLPAWSIALDEAAANVEEAEVSDEVYEWLRYNAKTTGRWEQDGMRWEAYLFGYEPNPRNKYVLYHAPRVCLPAVGMRLVRDHGTKTVVKDRLRIPFQVTEWRQGAASVHVFFCQWRSADYMLEPYEFRGKWLKRLEYIEHAWLGLRGSDAQTLGVYVTASVDADTTKIHQRMVDAITTMIQPAE